MPLASGFDGCGLTFCTGLLISVPLLYVSNSLGSPLLDLCSVPKMLYYGHFGQEFADSPPRGMSRSGRGRIPKML